MDDPQKITAHQPTLEGSMKASSRPTLFREIAQAALTNAESLLEDARTLEGKGKFGHAFVLAVLADEEVAKARTFWLASQGFATTNLSGKSLRIGEKILEPFRLHKEKQIIQFATRWIDSMIDPIFDEVTRALDTGPEGMWRAMTVAEEHIKEVAKDQAKMESFLKPLLEFSQIQRERDRGLYVDIQEGKLTEPSSFPADRCREFLEVVASEIEGARRLLSHDELGEFLRKFLTLSRDIIGRRDMRKFFRQRGGGDMLNKIRKELKKIS